MHIRKPSQQAPDAWRGSLFNDKLIKYLCLSAVYCDDGLGGTMIDQLFPNFRAEQNGQDKAEQSQQWGGGGWIIRAWGTNVLHFQFWSCKCLKSSQLAISLQLSWVLASVLNFQVETDLVLGRGPLLQIDQTSITRRWTLSLYDCCLKTFNFKAGKLGLEKRGAEDGTGVPPQDTNKVVIQIFLLHFPI